MLFRRFLSNSSSSLKKTPLYDWHVTQYGGKMVDFAGYSMPVYYKDVGIVQSHLHTRKEASLFDVSHMGQIRIHGKDKISFLESISPSELTSLQKGNGKLSLLTNAQGGIVDDFVITKDCSNDYFDIVLNAGNYQNDMKHITTCAQEFKGDMIIEPILDMALLALQGPTAVSVLMNLCDTKNISNMPFMTSMDIEIKGIIGPVHITRCGYTGEDGYEIRVNNNQAESLAETLCKDPRVKPAGLGARDSLRLEAGLCLHGSDISSKTTPVEAGLAWTISPARRNDKTTPFLGSTIILEQLRNKSNTRKRVGLVMPSGQPPARHGASVLCPEGNIVGTVTSGTLSPSLRYPIAMAYVNRGYFKVGTSLQVQVRDKMYPCLVSKMPFVPTRYFKLP